MDKLQQSEELSDAIRSCQAGAAGNPYQGKDKKVLFVCSMGILRSATAARIYAHKYNTRCAGTYEDALIPLTLLLIVWADQIVFVNKNNYQSAMFEYADILNKKETVVLDIPDMYEHKHPKLIEAFEEQYERL